MDCWRQVGKGNGLIEAGKQAEVDGGRQIG